MKYNKLVRDNIPEIIIKKGGKPVIHIANDEEYWEKLKEKLVEEAKEFQEAGTPDEIADVWEVIEAILDLKKFTQQEVFEIKNKKAQERGKFKKKIILDES